VDRAAQGFYCVAVTGASAQHDEILVSTDLNDDSTVVSNGWTLAVARATTLKPVNCPDGGWGVSTAELHSGNTATANAEDEGFDFVVP
jgi:hypothetical protein